MVMNLAPVVIALAMAADPQAQEILPVRTEPLPSLSLQELPPWLADRGDGVHNSMFGTYTRKHELQVYLFYEYTVNHDEEYKPEELGFVGAKDFRAKRVDHEFLIFLAYGITEDLIVEFESAVWTKATQHKASGDTSAMPSTLSEHGLGDTEGQIRYRFIHESQAVPEFLAFFEYVLPLQKERKLIGTQDWELELGIQVTKGFSFGTFTAKISYAYDRAESKAELGEYALEYTKRLSDQWRIVLCVEGTQDEIEGIVEVQWMPAKNIMIKINNAVGLTSKAADWAPELGILISF